jgi:hypothetical protein
LPLRAGPRRRARAARRATCGRPLALSPPCGAAATAAASAERSRVSICRCRQRRLTRGGRRIDDHRSAVAGRPPESGRPGGMGRIRGSEYSLGSDNRAAGDAPDGKPGRRRRSARCPAIARGDGCHRTIRAARGDAVACRPSMSARIRPEFRGLAFRLRSPESRLGRLIPPLFKCIQPLV